MICLGTPKDRTGTWSISAKTTPHLPWPLGSWAQCSYLGLVLELRKRLGYRWAMLFQSTSSSWKPWPERDRLVALPACWAPASWSGMWSLHTWEALLTSPAGGDSFSEKSLESLKVSAVTTCRKGPRD